MPACALRAQRLHVLEPDPSLHADEARSCSRTRVVLAWPCCLASLGIYNIVLKATWTLMDDGVFWSRRPQGVVAAARVAPGGPARPRGRRAGDVLLALDGEEVADRRAGRGAPRAAPARRARRATRCCAPTSGARSRSTVQPLSQGNVSLFYYLSLVGFFSLVVGTIVMLRRPPDRAALHFYAICLLFFLMYSTRTRAS